MFLKPKSEHAKFVVMSCGYKRIILRHGHIAITGYRMGDNFAFEKYISAFDSVSHSYDMVGGYYVKRFKELRVNRGMNIDIIQRYFPNHQVYVDDIAYPAEKIGYINLFKEPKDKFQIDAIKFMACRDKYRGNIHSTQQIIDADTGKGKTYLGVVASVLWKGKTIIFVPKSILLDAWKESYMKFTNVPEDRILIVKGSSKCEKIRLGEYTDKDVFIFSIETFISYMTRYGDMKTMEMLKMTNCAIKIIDEFHLNMNTCNRIEALSNFRLNYYMSASPGRSNVRENRVFSNMFVAVPRLSNGSNETKSDHINIAIKNYQFIPTMQEQRAMVNRNRGLNSKVYESSLMNANRERKESFVMAMLYMLKMASKKLVDDNKILILTGTIDAQPKIKTIVDAVFDDDESSIYNSKLTKDEKKKALKKRVIVATEQSLGTGADIKGIQFVFNIVTYVSPISVIQNSGRARKLNNADVWYVEFVNTAYDYTRSQFQRRLKYLRDRTNNELDIIP